MPKNNSPPFTVVGAGPAGLAAAYELARRGANCMVFEKDSQVGGLAKTTTYHGYRYDVGPHRFFTKCAEVEQLWRDLLPDDFLQVRRLTRIYYRGKLLNYPLTPLNALRGLGLSTSLQAAASFAYSWFLPKKPERSFADWVSNRFGRKLYAIFFKAYTEKIWGIPCTELSSDWASQRIRNLNLGRAVLKAIGIGRREITSLVDHFHYPRYGAGQMYVSLAEKAAAHGTDLRLRHAVNRVNHRDGRIVSIAWRQGETEGFQPVQALVSSMPVTDLVQQLDPVPPAEVLEAARGLYYRSIVTVHLVVQQREIVPDNWLYLHCPDVRAARLQVCKNWSDALAPDASRSSIGLEYFVTEGDSLWKMSDGAMMEMAMQDLRQLRLVSPEKVCDGFVARHPKAYPVYDRAYHQRVRTIREHLSRYTNLVCVGRGGQFRYNNMDHSVMTGLIGARRLLGGVSDPWPAGASMEYLEDM